MAMGLAVTLGLRPVAPNRATASNSGGEMTLAAIRSTTDPAIVDIVSTLANDTGTAAGTGIVLTSTGEILTNNHVIDGASRIKVTDIGNGTTYAATVGGYDQTDDVAVLQLQGASGLKTAAIGDSSGVTRGESVTALGNAGGAGGTPSVTSGVVTALKQSITATDTLTGASEQLSGVIESNVRLQSGDSGGPLVDASGHVIAMNSAASSGIHIQVGTGPTRSYSIPINQALRLANQMQDGQASTTVHVGATGILGVVLSSTEGDHGNLVPGVKIFGVAPGSPAGRAGVIAGDVITAVEGNLVDSPRSVSAVLAHYHPGDKVTFTWTDSTGQIHHSTVVLTIGPAA